MRRLRAFFPLFLLASTALAGEGDLGKIQFPTSGSAEAQPHFLRGALLLHSFEYEDARDAFRAARGIEPGFAMAAWGEAMTFNHPLWLRQNLDEARAALGRLAPTPAERGALAPTAREKGYLRAVEILYGEGDKAERDAAYAEAMAELSSRFPDDLDAAAFHALALLGTCHDGRDPAVYMRAAAIVEEVFDENPEHPGAAHYLIHSYDDPVHAPLGVRAARLYAQIAPAAVHALHMPSHVFLALGLWDETASSNEDSWQASLARRERLGLGVDAKSYHALLWLEYAYLQQGRHRDARELLAIMEADAAASGSERTRSHLAYMRAHYLVETRRWHEHVAAPELEGLDLRPAATVLFTDGLAALHRGERELAEAKLASLRARRLQILGVEAGGDHCAGGYARTGPESTLEAEIMELELEGLLALERGDTEEGLDKLAQAAVLEQDSPFGFGPPVPPKPAQEILGEALLELGRPQEARERLEAALARAPRRVRSLEALRLAAAGAGEAALAARALETLKQIAHRADAEVAETVGAVASR